MAAISVLAILAGLQWLRAERQRGARRKRLNQKHRSALKGRNSCGKRAGQASAKPSVNSSWGEWREGIALLARATKFDPENPVASERFFQELIVHREKALPLPIASFDHQDLVVGAAFSPDGARILTASADKTAKLWDAASGKLIASFDHQGERHSTRRLVRTVLGS